MPPRRNPVPPLPPPPPPPPPPPSSTSSSRQRPGGDSASSGRGGTSTGRTNRGGPRHGLPPVESLLRHVPGSLPDASQTSHGAPLSPPTQPSLSRQQSGQSSAHHPSISGSGMPGTGATTSGEQQSRYWTTVLAASSSSSPTASPHPGFSQTPPPPPVPPPPPPPSSSPAPGPSPGSRGTGGTGHSSGSSGEGRTTRRGNLRCDHCGRQFDRRSDLMTHQQREHNPQPTFACRFPGCDKIFGHRSSRSRHEKAHRWPRESGR